MSIVHPQFRSRSRAIGSWRRTSCEATLLNAVFSLAFLLFATAAWAQVPIYMGGSTYHVDVQHPLASPAGPGSPGQPYDSISNALLAHHDTTTIILVHPGLYRERVSVPASGNLRHKIVVRATGPGVVLDGADDLGSPAQWVRSVGDVWLAPAVDWSPVQVFADGNRLVPAAVAPAGLVPGAFVYVPGSGLFVNLGGDNPGAHAAAVGRRSHGFLVSGKTDLVIDGFEVVRCEDKGIEVISSERVIVRNCRVTGAWGGGIGVEASRDVELFRNSVSDNNHHGILFRLGVTNSRIEENECFANAHVGEAWATGIYLSGSPGNVIECNRVHDNQDSGIEVQTGSNDNIVRQNMSWSNGDHGFAQLYATGTALIGNVAYNNAHEGFSVEGDATGTRIYNCIAYNPGITVNTYCLLVDSSSTAGFSADYNILWNALGAAPVKYGPDIYASVSAFRSATGIGLHTFAADPRFVDGGNGDFHLRPESPAIDAGSSSIAGWEVTDAEGRARFDAPGTPDTGDGPVSFGDRGAIEFQTGVLAVGGRSSSPGLSLANAFPNPSRRSVEFTLETATDADVSWAVFDVLGREVFSSRARFAAGRQQLHWPLTDRSGARVANGIYMVRVERAGESSSMRFVVMK